MRAAFWTLVSRVRGVFGSRAQDEDFDREVDGHLALLTADNIRRGMSPGEARRAAVLRFGGPAQIKERQRGQRGLPFVDATLQDVRYALRTFARNPGFAALAILTLGLGIGVNTTVFTAFDATALRGLPGTRPGRLVRAIRTLQGGGLGDLQYAFSYAEFVEHQTQAHSLQGLIAASWPIRVAHDDGSLIGQLVSDEYFSALGIVAAAGRTFVAGDSRARAPIIVLSGAGWRDQFGADALIVGRTIRLNDTLFTVVGVTPPEFIGSGNPPRTPDFWAPIVMQPALLPGTDWMHSDQIRRLQLIARLAAGASPRSARTELTQLAARMETETGRDRTIDVTLERATLFGGMRDPRFEAFVALVMIVVGLVLLIACANLSNLMLARASSRQREIAVRLALGASRARVVRQLLTESLLLAVAGGAAGLLFSTWACAWLWTSSAETLQGVLRLAMPGALRFGPDVQVFGYTLAVSLIAGLAFGLSPAWQFSNPELTSALKGDYRAFGRRISRTALRDWLIAGQVAAALGLLIPAGLLARGTVRSENVEPGYPVGDLFYVAFNHGTQADEALRLQRRVFDRLNTLNELAGVTLVQRIPLLNTWTTEVGDAEAASANDSTLANYVSPEYFDTMRIPITRGRGFMMNEPAGNAVVSEATARRLFPNADPLGRRLKLSTSQAREPEYHEFVVVGVSRDVSTASAGRPDPGFVYLPTSAAGRYEILVRSRTTRHVAMDAVRAAVAGVDPHLALSMQMAGLDQLLRDQRLLTSTLAAFATGLAVLALALAAIGIYGVMGFLVERRVHEIGVRMALGAGRGGVVRMILRDGLRPVVAGGAIGLLLALAISGVVRATLIAPSTPDLLFGVGPFDAITFLAGPLGFVALALAACAVPAYRAARVDPMIVLRIE